MTAETPGFFALPRGRMMSPTSPKGQTSTCSPPKVHTSTHYHHLVGVPRGRLALGARWGTSYNLWGAQKIRGSSVKKYPISIFLSRHTLTPTPTIRQDHTFEVPEPHPRKPDALYGCVP